MHACTNEHVRMHARLACWYMLTVGDCMYSHMDTRTHARTNEKTRTHILLLTYSCSLAVGDCMDTINAAYHVTKPCT